MFCLDTNIVIHALNRRRPDFAARISEELRAGRTLLIPAVVRFELEYGLARSQRPEANRAILDTFLARGFEQPAFDLDDAAEAGAPALEAVPAAAFAELAATHGLVRSAFPIRFAGREGSAAAAAGGNSGGGWRVLVLVPIGRNALPLRSGWQRTCGLRRHRLPAAGFRFSGSAGSRSGCQRAGGLRRRRAADA